VGYDPGASRDGAGNVLYGFAIRDSIERGDRLYDLGPGSLECKRTLATRFVPLLQYTHCSPRAVKGQLMRAAHRARHWFQARGAA
jgi:CelD/BcsL family acetyltransferase involved in cellulose biosynthesis